MTEQSPMQCRLADGGNVNARTIQYTATPMREMSAAHVLELRNRIREGAYRTEAVADVIARRMLAAGDM